MRIAVIGSGGMLGHMVYLRLKASGLHVMGYSKSAAATVDCVMEPENIRRVTSDVIINCAGILNDECDRQQELALETNAMLPHKLANNCDYLIHISTDCVFDGAIDGHGPKDKPNATSLYGRTKALGEIADNQNVVTLRQSVIGPSLKSTGAGLLHWALTQPGPLVPGYLGHTWNGVTTLELADLILRILRARAQGKRIAGIYQYVCETTVEKADLLEEIGRIWKCEWSVEKQQKPPVRRALAPDDRMKPPPSISHQMLTLYEWMKAKAEFYRHYPCMQGEAR